MTNKKNIRVAELIGRSYQVVSTNVRRYLQLLYIPFLALLVLGIGTLLIDSLLTRAYVAIVYVWLIPILMIPVITSWHRLILLGPHRAGARISYNFGPEEWLYLKMLVVLFIAIIGGNFLLAVLLGPIFAGIAQLTGMEVVGSIYRYLLLVILFVILCRFLLVLPSAALGKKWTSHNPVSLFREMCCALRRLILSR